jgi:histidinol-phosphatase (PHP family)
LLLTVARLYDQHLHSWHSFDCASPPRDNTLRALEVGLRGLTFTEHYDTHPEDWPTCRYNDETYGADLAILQEEFGGRIEIGRGIEVCYQPDLMDRILAFLDTGRFDAVLLSVHWLRDGAIHHRERWAGHTAAEMHRAYSGRVLEPVQTCVRLRRTPPVATVLGPIGAKNAPPKVSRTRLRRSEERGLRPAQSRLGGVR